MSTNITVTAKSPSYDAGCGFDLRVVPSNTTANQNPKTSSIKTIIASDNIRIVGLARLYNSYVIPMIDGD